MEWIQIQYNKIVGIKNGKDLYEIFYIPNIPKIYLVRDYSVYLKREEFDYKNLQTKIEEYKCYAINYERELIINKLI